MLVAALALIAWSGSAVCANKPPVGSFIATLAEEGTSAVRFDATGSTDADGQVTRYQWVFGDGTTGSGSIVVHAYPTSSTYTVTLLVGDNGGATHLVTQAVDVSRLSAVPVADTAVTAAPTASTAPIGYRVGQRAPQIDLPGLNGGVVRLSDLLGKVVIVEFWVSTCPGCRASVPGLVELREVHAERGLAVLFVILDRAADDARAFFAARGETGFFMAWESDAANRPTMAAYGVSLVPHAFLIDRTGVIRYSGSPGGIRPEVLAAWL